MSNPPPYFHDLIQFTNKSAHELGYSLSAGSSFSAGNPENNNVNNINSNLASGNPQTASSQNRQPLPTGNTGPCAFYIPKLEGDVDALNLIDLDKEGLSEYKSQLGL